MREDRFSKKFVEISSFFESNSKKVFSGPEINGILFTQQPAWQLPRRMTTEIFLNRMCESSPLRNVQLSFPRRTYNFWTWGEVDLLEVLMHLDSRCFASHLTAAELHGIAPFKLSEIFINVEQELGSPNDATLEQGRIDAAFKRAPRVSNTLSRLEGQTIHFLAGKNTRRFGVESLTRTGSDGRTYEIRYPTLERTLLDMTVRPQYAGGVEGCLQAFSLASDRLSVPKLCETINAIGHIYPYHQSIGFYMEACGKYGSEELELIRAFPQEFDFYLDHQMKESLYIPQWRLHVPAALPTRPPGK